MLAPRRSLLAFSLVLAACASAPSAPPPVIEPGPPAPLPTAAPVAAPSAAPPTAAPAAALTYAVDAARGPGGQTLLLVKLPCAEPRCALRPLNLGAGELSGRPLVVDLQGPSFSFQHHGSSFSFDDQRPSRAAAPVTAGALFPAVMVLLSAGSGGGSRLRLVVVSLRGDEAVEIFSEDLDWHRPGGGGFSTINAVELESAGAGPLEIAFSQTSEPGPGDRPFRPGPPLQRRFRFDGTRYVRQP